MQLPIFRDSGLIMRLFASVSAALAVPLVPWAALPDLAKTDIDSSGSWVRVVRAVCGSLRTD
jgi:hypothetical protein